MPHSTMKPETRRTLSGLSASVWAQSRNVHLAGDRMRAAIALAVFVVSFAFAMAIILGFLP